MVNCWRLSNYLEVAEINHKN